MRSLATTVLRIPVSRMYPIDWPSRASFGLSVKHNRLFSGIQLMQLIDFELRGEYIALDALLKALGVAPSGGAAKLMVAEGRVQVDGRDELRKTCKIRALQVVSVAGVRVTVLAAPSGDALANSAAAGQTSV